MAAKKVDYAEILIRQGTISAEQLAEAKRVARTSGKKAADQLSVLEDNYEVVRDECLDQTSCLHLVASGGTTKSINHGRASTVPNLSRDRRVGR